MIRLFRVAMAPEAIEAVTEVLKSGYIGQGPKVDYFERHLSAVTDQLCITTNSGTSALELALKLAGVGPDDEVISTPLTCLATNAAIIRTGARIVWSDIDPDTGLIVTPINPKLISDKTKAIMAVDWAGAKPNYKELRETGHAVIEDAAHVFGHFDVMESGDYICLSFQAIKFLTTGDGGALMPPIDQYERARRLRWFGYERDTNESFRCNQIVNEVGYKAQMNDIAASIGLANLELAKRNVEIQRANAARLMAELNDLEAVQIALAPRNESPWLFLIKTPRRADFIEYMKSNGIEASPTHRRNDAHDGLMPYADKRVSLKGLEHYDSRHCAIPVGWWLTEEDLMKVAKTVRAWDVKA